MTSTSVYLHTSIYHQDIEVFHRNPPQGDKGPSDRTFVPQPASQMGLQREPGACALSSSRGGDLQIPPRTVSTNNRSSMNQNATIAPHK